MRAAAVALACILRFAGSAQAAEAARPLFAGAFPPVAPAAASRDPTDHDPTDRDSTDHTSASDPKSADAKTDASGKVGSHDDHRNAAVKIKVDPQQSAREIAKPRQEASRRDGAHARVCFNAAETRETVAAHRLSEPFRALRAGRLQGEALRAKLCKWKQDEFVYEISVLRRDGRIVRLYMNAQSGQAVGALDGNDRH